MSSKKEQTREKILNAAYGLFARDGFCKVTMKDVCEAAGLSRGGVYSHFPGTKEMFEAILEELNKKEELDFEKEMAEGVPAADILEQVLLLLTEEMKHPEDSLSLAMYEYAAETGGGQMDYFNGIGEEKWKALIEYGIRRGEFLEEPGEKLIPMIFFVYQGIRMWSRIVTVTPDTITSVMEQIRRQLVK